MAIVIADLSTEKQLAAAGGPVEVKNAAGRTLGVFTPQRLSEDELYARAAALFDPAEIERRMSLDEPSLTAEEVRAHLASLGRDAG